ncbi:MAG: oxygenase MpaB family protein [Nitrospinae bacterium]|nr:oxygenase MpaB family protein [Nitrospinota bacterium]
MATLVIPSAYVEGYENKARPHDQELADLYIRHTTIGDPVLDPIMEEISSLPTYDLHAFIEAGIEQHDGVLRDAPQPLRDFFWNFEEPAWLDHEAFRPGIRCFNVNVDLMLVAFVTGVLVEGFSTLIAKSFNKTGRTAATPRRLMQNNRQLMEIFYPGGLLRNGDGWKLSTRVRFVHARIRNLLAKSGDWDFEAWGAPLSAANLGLAISIFSMQLLRYSKLVGTSFSIEEQESVLAVWRYAGYLMGIPETILYTDGADAERKHDIAYMCEPPPSADSVDMANALIKAIAPVAGVTDPKEQEDLTDLAYRLSTALIGQELAGQFGYPKHSRLTTMLTLYIFRTKQRLLRFLHSKQIVKSQNFSQLLKISVYDEGGISYRMPDRVKASESSKW